MDSRRKARYPCIDLLVSAHVATSPTKQWILTNSAAQNFKKTVASVGHNENDISEELLSDSRQLRRELVTQMPSSRKSLVQILGVMETIHKWQTHMRTNLGSGASQM